MYSHLRLTALTLIILCAASSAHAVITSVSKHPRNTSEPTGALEDSGWQWQGQWGGFLGTPIARNYFITANHIGGNLGDFFYYDGRQYEAIETYDDPESDLQIWKVDGRFSSWAPLYRGTKESGKLMTTFGRGTDRGDRVIVDGQVKGWEWGASDGVQSWGTNIVSGALTVPDSNGEGQGTVPNGGLFWTFDRLGTAQESTISNGDSGGGVFIEDTDGRWKIAGINFLVDANFTLPGGGDIQAALFDMGGLTLGDDDLADLTKEIPSRAVATRISSRYSWISDVIYGRTEASAVASRSVVNGVPEPTGALGLLMFTTALAARRRANHS